MRGRILLSLLAVLFVAGCGRSDPPQDFVARLGDRVLTQDELSNQLRSLSFTEDSLEARQQIIEQWLTNELLYREARRRGLRNNRDVQRLLADTMLVSTPAPEPFDRVAALPVGGRTDSFFERGRRMIRINDGVEPARTKTFEEAMPALITVYQETLEERVMARLRRHYGVQLFPDRLAHVRRADPATPAVSEIRLD